MLGFVIFFIFFGGMFIFMGIALIRSIIIMKKEHPYRYCAYPREITIFKDDPFEHDLGVNPSTGYPMVDGGIDASGTAIGDTFDW